MAPDLRKKTKASGMTHSPWSTFTSTAAWVHAMVNLELKAGVVTNCGEAGAIGSSGSDSNGITTLSPHFGHLPVFPAESALTLIDLSQCEQLNRITQRTPKTCART
ncbi:MAG: hypothetical protein COA78_36465 [Blastopirellula sp.]|nr:MAG: hypothetical protein COA78_36465 [Blastopirellula sp.]